MSVTVAYYFYIAVLLLWAILSLPLYRHSTSLGRSVTLLLWLTVLAEVLSRVTNALNLTKGPTYHFFNVAELQIITVCFLRAATPRVSARLSLITFIGYTAIAIINIILFQPLRKLNSNFIELESFLIISMSLWILFRMYIDDTVSDVTAHQPFWVWTWLLVYATGTFLFWPSVKYIYRQKLPYKEAIICGQIFLNCVCYCGLGYSVIRYRKL